MTNKVREEAVKEWKILKEIISKDNRSRFQFQWGQLLRALGIKSLNPNLTLEVVIEEIKRKRTGGLEEEKANLESSVIDLKKQLAELSKRKFIDNYPIKIITSISSLTNKHIGEVNVEGKLDNIKFCPLFGETIIKTNFWSNKYVSVDAETMQVAVLKELGKKTVSNLSNHRKTLAPESISIS